MIVLDASALLAFLFRETGHEMVAAVLDSGCLSTVNLAEVLGRFARDGRDSQAVLDRILASPIEVVPFEARDAAVVARLLPLTRSIGLSLGDRACLALALTRGIPALTADLSWSDLQVDVEIRVIR